jgi:starch synthase
MRSSANLRVLSVTSEVFPLVKTGGLADVAGALPPALAAEGVAMRTLVPGYPGVVEALRSPAIVHSFGAMHGGPARLLAANVAGLDLFVLDAPHLYARPVVPTLARTAAMARTMRSALRRLAPRRPRSVAAPFLHSCPTSCTRMTGGPLAPAYLHYGALPRPRTVMTCTTWHFRASFRRRCSPPSVSPHAYALDGVEYFGTISYLKAGWRLPTGSRRCRRITPRKFARPNSGWDSKDCCGTGLRS